MKFHCVHDPSMIEERILMIPWIVVGDEKI
jgi:hypothetical protein